METEWRESNCFRSCHILPLNTIGGEFHKASISKVIWHLTPLSTNQNKTLNPRIPLVFCGTCIQMKYSYLSTQLLGQSQRCGVRLWQSETLQSGLYLNTFIIKPYIFTLLSAGHKYETLILQVLGMSWHNCHICILYT